MRAVRIVLPVVLTWLLALSWSYPWPNFALHVAILSGALSVARGVYGLFRPEPRRADMTPSLADSTIRLMLGLGVGALVVGLALYALVRPPSAPPGVSGADFDFFVAHYAGAVLLGYAATLLVHVGVACLARAAGIVLEPRR